MRLLLVLLAWFAFQTPAWSVEPGEDLSTPEITIRYEEDKTLYEYWVNGQLVEIKVVPNNAPTYYLVPENGGFIQADRSQFGTRVLTPSWVLFRW